MMAISDAEYRFLYVDVGAYGSEGDASIFNGSDIGTKIIHDTLPLPADTKIGSKAMPFFFVGDDAFPFCKRIMKPYSPGKNKQLTNEENIFNYRLSRARRCVENSFGILSSKWQCLSRTLFSSPDRAQKIVLACCHLHNFLLKNSRENYGSLSPTSSSAESELSIIFPYRLKIFFEQISISQVTNIT